MLAGAIEQIDTIPLPTGFVILLRRSDVKVPFSATGHFPIMAFQKEFEQPSYLAIARDEMKTSRKYITTVKEGDSVATYYNRNGEVKLTDDFQVLALRYDPIDFPADPMFYQWRVLRPRAGSLDPTGPVYWLQYYPEMDPEFFEDAKEEVPYTLMRVLASLDGERSTVTESRDEMMVEDSDDPFEDVEFSDEEDSLKSDIQSDSEAESAFSDGFLDFLDDITESSNEGDSPQEALDDQDSLSDSERFRKVENTTHSSYVQDPEDSENCGDILKELDRPGSLEAEGGASGPSSEIRHSTLKGGQ